MKGATKGPNVPSGNPPRHVPSRESAVLWTASERARICAKCATNPKSSKKIDHVKREVVTARFFEIPAEAIGKMTKGEPRNDGKGP